MPDDSWYYARDGKRLGPFTLAQLAQMVAADMVGPSDLVMRAGDREWVAADTVPELFPPATSTVHTPPEAAGTRLVACDRCQSRISDVAEHCPQCGHPQPPLTAKDTGQELVPCPDCQARNLVRDYWTFLPGNCRGCDRPFEDAYPQVRFQVAVDEVYRKFVGWQNDLYNVILPAGAVIGGLVAYVAAGLCLPAWAAVVALLVGGVAGWAAALPVFADMYQRLFVRGRTLPAPHQHLTISDSDWRQAEWREGQEEMRRDARIRAVRGAAVPAAGTNWGGWVVGLVVVGGGVAFWLWSDKTKTDKQHVDQEKLVGAAMTRG